MTKNQGKNDHIKQVCLGKIKHKSWLSAEYTLNKMRRTKDSHLLEIYRCPFCKDLHIGHNKKLDKRPNKKTDQAKKA